jgi:dCTP deaminase
MAVLTREEIIRNIEEGNIIIDPLDKSNIGPASIDLHIDNKFRTFKKIHKVIEITEDIHYEKFTDFREVQDYFMILPGEMVLGITREKITLAPHLCGRLDGRSRFARMGLTMHITAGFVQPGTSNRQVLEIYNNSPIPLLLKPGTKLIQFIFETCIGEARYEGRFRDQKL